MILFLGGVTRHARRRLHVLRPYSPRGPATGQARSPSPKSIYAHRKSADSDQRRHDINTEVGSSEVTCRSWIYLTRKGNVRSCPPQDGQEVKSPVTKLAARVRSPLLHPTGRFRFRRNRESHCCIPRLIGWPRKKPVAHTEGNNIVEFAPSVAEADAILAKFGYAERELAAA